MVLDPTTGEQSGQPPNGESLGPVLAELLASADEMERGNYSPSTGVSDAGRNESPTASITTTAALPPPPPLPPLSPPPAGTRPRAGGESRRTEGLPAGNPFPGPAQDSGTSQLTGGPSLEVVDTGSSRRMQVVAILRRLLGEEALDQRPPVRRARTSEDGTGELRKFVNWFFRVYFPPEDSRTAALG